MHYSLPQQYSDIEQPSVLPKAFKVTGLAFMAGLIGYALTTHHGVVAALLVVAVLAFADRVQRAQESSRPATTTSPLQHTDGGCVPGTAPIGDPHPEGRKVLDGGCVSRRSAWSAVARDGKRA